MVKSLKGITLMSDKEGIHSISQVSSTIQNPWLYYDENEMQRKAQEI